jgi:F-type H+-transporting ATPase subunit b
VRIRKLLAAGMLAAAGAVLLQAAPATAAPATHEAEECIHLLENGGKVDDCQQAPSPILPATNEIVWGGLAFIILFFLLAKFGYPAMRSMMDARTERLRADLDAAEAAKNEAEALLVDYQRQLADARNESSRIIEEARQQAEQVRRDLTARAEAEAAELRQRTSEQVAAERDRVLGELRSLVAGLAIELAEKVVEASLDRDANLRLIENYINQVGNGART